MEYRREIDGLRAFAVVAVILYHTGLGLVPGGFVGVDVFFVISGYLITGILSRELAEGCFSLAGFYERRARRILPALVLVVACCLPFAWAWMLPHELADFGQSMVALALFMSNVLFWREESYFASTGELKPLLHTWSLSVEEQYYLLFPLLLWGLWKLGRRWTLWGLAGLALASLALSGWGTPLAPSAAFYLLPARMWELLAGALCALMLRDRPFKAHASLGLAGLGLMIAAMVLIDDQTVFPGWSAMLPVCGTVLVILHARGGNLAARLLSWPGFTALGLVSYSAYLWHQPLFAFARMRSLTVASPMLLLALAVLSFVLAYASWRWVEQPFRRKGTPLLPQRRAVLGAGAACAFAFLAIGLGTHVARGFPARGPAGVDLEELELRLSTNYGLDEACDGGVTLSPLCQTAPDPEVVLWGDSFAMHLAAGIVASDPAVRLRQQTLSQCSPIVGMAPLDADLGPGWARDCIAFNDAMLQWLATESGVSTVILSSHWGLVTERDLMRRDGRIVPRGELTVVSEGVIETARRLRAIGKRVVIVGPTPPSEWDNSDCLARSIMLRIDLDRCNFPREAASPPERLMRAVAREVPVYPLWPEVCTDGLCQPSRGETLLYIDNGHLSYEGSALLGRTNHWLPRWREMAR